MWRRSENCLGVLKPLFPCKDLIIPECLIKEFPNSNFWLYKHNSGKRGIEKATLAIRLSSVVDGFHAIDDFQQNLYARNEPEEQHLVNQEMELQRLRQEFETFKKETNLEFKNELKLQQEMYQRERVIQEALNNRLQEEIISLNQQLKTTQYQLNKIYEIQMNSPPLSQFSDYSDITLFSDEAQILGVKRKTAFKNVLHHYQKLCLLFHSDKTRNLPENIQNKCERRIRKLNDVMEHIRKRKQTKQITIE